MAEELQKVKDHSSSFSVDSRFEEAQRLVEQVDLFDNIVSHSYLQSLSDCEVIPYQATDLTTMRWYEITKIVVEKNVFFPDKLSMLYTSLHKVAKNVVLIIDKSDDSKIRLFLGARDFKGVSNISGEVLKAGLDGFLSGVQTKVLSRNHPASIFDNPYVSSVSGVGSLRDDKKEVFLQGIEKLINATSNIPKFTAYFIADNVSDKEAKSIIEAYNDLHNHISPFAESLVTFSENTTEGVSESLTESFSQSIAKSLSNTITNTEGYNESTTYSTGSSQTESKNHSIGYNTPGLLSLFVGGLSYNFSKGSSETTQESTSVQNGSSSSKAKAEQTGETNTDQRGESKQKGTNHSTTKGSSRQLTFKNNYARYYLEILDEQIKRMKKGSPYGLWSTSAYFVAEDCTTANVLANLYRGCIIGESSNIESFAINTWTKADNNKTIVKYLVNSLQPLYSYRGIIVTAGSIVTSEELAIHMSLPQSSVPGVEVRERVSFGRNIDNVSSKQSYICLGQIKHLGVTSTQNVDISIDELSKHVLVTGSTGSGKSNTVYLLVDNLLKEEKKVLIIEPTKGDYRKVFGGRMKVYGTRENERDLLRINPFAFPEQIHVIEHIERLVEIFGVCWPMYAAMPAVLKDSILSAYEACGWNLRTSRCRFGRLYPTVADVVSQLRKIIDSSRYSSDTKGDYIGALQTRLESLTNGVYATILSSSNSTDYRALFDSNVIIDLHRIGSSDTRSLLMGLLVLALSEWRQANGEDKMNQKLQHVTVLEEAHCILPNVSKQQSQESSNVLGKSVEMISTAIAEMRTFGESFIIVDQSPSALDEAAIRNTNTKIVMNLPDGLDREIAGRSMALSKDDQIDELARLSTGEAIVWQRGWNEAVMAAITEMTEMTPNVVQSLSEGVFEEDRREISETLLSYLFSKNNEIQENNRENIITEIISSNLSSIEKAYLLNPIYEPDIAKDTLFTNAALSFLKMDKEFVRLLERYPNGSPEIIKNLRIYMIKDLGIKDKAMQANILSMLFQWASSKSEKWHKVCSNSLKLLST